MDIVKRIKQLLLKEVRKRNDKIFYTLSDKEKKMQMLVLGGSIRKAK